MAKEIKHLVVLMLENRSFDHMLGFLKSSTYPIDGLNGNETNPDSTGSLVQVSNDAKYVSDLKDDPGHDFISVNEQIFGNSQGAGSGPYMQGFVKSYQAKTGNLVSSRRVMKCFRSGRLPALTTLAKEFAVCDRWFSSVPGPTLPNRAFVYGATSQGRVNMSPNYLTLKTIFERLTEHGVSSKIYYTDWTFAIGVKHIGIDNPNKYFRFYDDFKNDCKKNKLPAYSFIEPRYYDRPDRGPSFLASDQHPDHNVFNGEKVIKEVYEAVTKNKQTWESTILVITYDEHGGLFDHVRPPDAVSPGDAESAMPPFKFDRLGVRVPAVIVSPYIPRGTIVHDVFDHTSIIATARKLFLAGKPNTWLTERDRNANTFEGCLTLATPRSDKPSIPEPSKALTLAATKPGSKLMTTNGDRKLSELQEVALVQMISVDTRKQKKNAQTGTIVPKTEQQAGKYFEEAQARLKLGKKTKGK
ncbi:MAG TPA: alkaline phosphatase family protein [Pyrinomonadaceae bacterium]|nr:alkaline phosphatase family protein [Pyrinomonadaceae bacterium]